jgi:hypothetical protein
MFQDLAFQSALWAFSIGFLAGGFIALPVYLIDIATDVIMPDEEENPDEPV